MQNSWKLISIPPTNDDLEPMKIKANRTLPEFETILKCGRTPEENNTMLSKVDSMAFNSPLDIAGRINRMFDKAQLSFANTNLASDSQMNEINTGDANIDQLKSNVLSIFYDPLDLETPNWYDASEVVKINNGEKSTAIANPINPPSEDNQTALSSADIALDDISTKMIIWMILVC
uniref:Uncharacterized protein n=1 Tax=Trichobilharzia regenti TaxID=157069 RepID=A0AA85J1J1_TRIRE|nr:unnamed protein product [Trichobilharzia regenti]